MQRAWLETESELSINHKNKTKKENKTVNLRTVIIGKGNKLLSVQSFNRRFDKETYN